MRLVLSALGALMLAGWGALAASPAEARAAMPITGATSQPVGHYEFCRREPEHCRRNPVRALVRLTPALEARLERVNSRANAAIAPRTDEEVYGEPEVWTYPTRLGDCEDYVLYKQRALEEEGLPASALLITVVRQPDGSGHAVLTVRTDKGDLILDNLDDRILPWDATPYTYLKRQSEAHAGRWLAIQDTRDLLVGSVR